MQTYQMLRSCPDIYDALVDIYSVDLSDFENETELLVHLSAMHKAFNMINEDNHAETMAANLAMIIAMIKTIINLNAKPADENMTFVKRTKTHHTGGNCWVDVIELNDGHYVGITDEAVCLYAPDVKPDDFLYQDIGHIYIPA